ncbi:UNKNOWN [Stylonychia lemnae]|uniref:Transmembrane protein n=1 Tax=Stylonychia lemnae TaxID=5949 RepID=A0A078A219_STYLE|nr:UNKNOWN [Stylonychia lemnae]|eukprot:CDW75857.1 UNKNOWN [Stylonychia lemnae]
MKIRSTQFLLLLGLYFISQSQIFAQAQNKRQSPNQNKQEMHQIRDNLAQDERKLFTYITDSLTCVNSCSSITQNFCALSNTNGYCCTTAENCPRTAGQYCSQDSKTVSTISTRWVCPQSTYCSIQDPSLSVKLDGSTMILNQTTGIPFQNVCKYLLEFPTKYKYSTGSSITITMRSSRSAAFGYVIANDFNGTSVQTSYLNVNASLSIVYPQKLYFYAYSVLGVTITLPFSFEYRFIGQATSTETTTTTTAPPTQEPTQQPTPSPIDQSGGKVSNSTVKKDDDEKTKTIIIAVVVPVAIILIIVVVIILVCCTKDNEKKDKRTRSFSTRIANDSEESTLKKFNDQSGIVYHNETTKGDNSLKQQDESKKKKAKKTENGPDYETHDKQSKESVTYIYRPENEIDPILLLTNQQDPQPVNKLKEKFHTAFVKKILDQTDQKKKNIRQEEDNKFDSIPRHLDPDYLMKVYESQQNLIDFDRIQPQQQSQAIHFILQTPYLPKPMNPDQNMDKQQDITYPDITVGNNIFEDTKQTLKGFLPIQEEQQNQEMPVQYIGLIESSRQKAQLESIKDIQSREQMHNEPDINFKLSASFTKQEDIQLGQSYDVLTPSQIDQKENMQIFDKQKQEAFREPSQLKTHNDFQPEKEIQIFPSNHIEDLESQSKAIFWEEQQHQNHIDVSFNQVQNIEESKVLEPQVLVNSSIEEFKEESNNSSQVIVNNQPQQQPQVEFLSIGNTNSTKKQKKKKKTLKPSVQASLQATTLKDFKNKEGNFLDTNTRNLETASYATAKNLNFSLENKALDKSIRDDMSEQASNIMMLLNKEGQGSQVDSDPNLLDKFDINDSNHTQGSFINKNQEKIEMDINKLKFQDIISTSIRDEIKAKQAQKIMDQEEHVDRNAINKSYQNQKRDDSSIINQSNNSRGMNRTKIVYVNEEGHTSIDPVYQKRQTLKSEKDNSMLNSKNSNKNEKKKGLQQILNKLDSQDISVSHKSLIIDQQFENQSVNQTQNIHYDEDLHNQLNQQDDEFIQSPPHEISDLFQKQDQKIQSQSRVEDIQDEIVENYE